RLVISFCLSYLPSPPILLSRFFFNDPATTEIYTLSLHDALPICPHGSPGLRPSAVSSVTRFGQFSAIARTRAAVVFPTPRGPEKDRKSTRLNSSHVKISYAVFCLKKKKHKHNEEEEKTHREKTQT